MHEFEFQGLAIHPGNGVLECLDAAGVDGRLPIVMAASSKVARRPAWIGRRLRDRFFRWRHARGDDAVVAAGVAAFDQLA